MRNIVHDAFGGGVPRLLLPHSVLVKEYPRDDRDCASDAQKHRVVACHDDNPSDDWHSHDRGAVKSHHC